MRRATIRILEKLWQRSNQRCEVTGSATLFAFADMLLNACIDGIYHDDTRLGGIHLVAHALPEKKSNFQHILLVSY